MSMGTQYDDTYFQSLVSEAEPYHDKWLTEAKIDMKYALKDQWSSDTLSQLVSQERPAFTLDVIGPVIRLYTGEERNSRYDLRALPVGDTDHDVARIMTGVLKATEQQNKAAYLYSEAFRKSLITGRGWIQPDIDYSDNVLGSIVLREIDPFEIMVDPFARQYDMRDARYLIRTLYLTEPEVAELYPEYIDRLGDFEVASPPYGTEYTDLPKYEIQEIWYKRWGKHSFILDRMTGDLIFATGFDQSFATREYEFVENDSMRIHYAIRSGQVTIEEGESPFRHNSFPYVPVFGEFFPKFGHIGPDWQGVVRGLRDPQDEKNKRRSLYVDLLTRMVHPGHRYTEGAIVNEDDLDDTRADKRIIMRENKFAEYEEIGSDAPNQALLQLDAVANEDVHRISGRPPSDFGIQETSRESGRTLLLRQQRGSTMATPYQDNMRLTRHLVAEQVLSLIQQFYRAPRIVKVMDQQENRQEAAVNMPDMASMRVTNDLTLGRYDIALAEVPSTPTRRQSEFMELMEMANAQILPPTPGIARVIIESSDISLKGKLLDVLDEEFRKAQEQQQQAMLAEQLGGGQ